MCVFLNNTRYSLLRKYELLQKHFLKATKGDVSVEDNLPVGCFVADKTSLT